MSTSTEMVKNKPPKFKFNGKHLQALIILALVCIAFVVARYDWVTMRRIVLVLGNLLLAFYAVVLYKRYRAKKR